jgi:hypothetical protein
MTLERFINSMAFREENYEKIYGLKHIWVRIWTGSAGTLESY